MNDRIYTSYEPVDEKEMNFRNPEGTVCELLRRTYHMSNDNDVKYNIRIAVAMTKRMGKKLRWYRDNAGHCPIDGKEEWTT